MFYKMPDSKLEYLIDRSFCQRIDVETIGTDALKPVVFAFDFNIGRISQIAQMPMAVASMAHAIEKQGSVNYSFDPLPPVTIPIRASKDPNDPKKHIYEYITIDNILWLRPYMNDANELKSRVGEAIARIYTY